MSVTGLLARMIAIVRPVFAVIAVGYLFARARAAIVFVPIGLTLGLV